MVTTGKEGRLVPLEGLPLPDRLSYQVQFFRAEDHKALIRLIEEKRPVLHDEISSQIRELIKIRHPQQKLTSGDIQEKYQDWLLQNDPTTYGVYVYYPWNNSLVHIVDEVEFIELRTSRNKHKITETEQEELRTKKVGVIGLSVGHSVAMAMATERIAGTIRIADFDILELSNLNRIRSKLTSIGLAKTTMVAREVAEIDPFIKVEVYESGINPENIDAFLKENGKLDLVIEVCDSLPIKILSRIKSRSLGIPVLMDTSDRGMIDIERFDYEPDRSILHGKCDIADLDELKALSDKQKMELLMSMVDFENLSDRMKYSFSELGKTITTWPQLASDVIAGGGLSAKIARRILLGERIASNRYYLDATEKINTN